MAKMNLNQAIEAQTRGERLPLRWRRRVGKWLARNGSGCKKHDQWMSGNDQRWTREVWGEQWLAFLDQVFEEKNGISFDGEPILLASSTAPEHELYTLTRE